MLEEFYQLVNKMNKKNKKGQLSSMELLIMVGLILAISVPFIAGILGNLNERVSIENRVQKAIELSNAIETVSNLGPGNSLSVPSEYDFEIVNNTLITTLSNGEEIIVPLLPSVPDSEVGGGVIEIINVEGGLFIGSPPSIAYLDPNPAKVVVSPGEVDENGELVLPEIIVNVKIMGDNFEETSKVFLDHEEIESEFVNENQITFTSKVYSLGEHVVYVVTVIGDKELVSNSVVLEVGYTISPGGIEIDQI
jgi:hypothetical protein|tara:strand:- start:16765 stop:17517 length:753 start_codon:yes stop_codon:yes gene_type:complete